MRFASPRRRKRAESTVAMINVVFLLLVFFLMTAEIAPPDPIDVRPPSAEATPATDKALTLFIAADGTLATAEATGDAVFASLEAEAAKRSDATLLLVADAALPATTLARLLPRLSAMGFAQVSLATSSPER